MEKRVTLFQYQDPGIKIIIEAYFDEKNQLVFEGFDFGPKVESVWGDPSYEYGYRIISNELGKLAKCLDTDKTENMGILDEIKKRFSGNRAYSEFGKFLDENHIQYDSNYH